MHEHRLDKNARRYDNITPVLGHLKAFEATARLGSMTKAAKEINTTVSSISRHNKIISDFLGVDLFEQNIKKLNLTSDGNILYHAVRQIFESLTEVASHISDIKNKNTVRIIVPRALMYSWINSKIKTFLENRPDFTIKVYFQEESTFNSTYLSISFEADSEHSEVLCQDEILPVANLACMGTESDSLIRLICTAKDMTDWDDWFHRIPELQNRKTSKILIADENAALEAACLGIGVVITRRSVAHNAIKERILSPFGDSSLKQSTFIWYTRPQNRSLSYEEGLFWNFLKSEAIR